MENADLSGLRLGNDQGADNQINNAFDRERFVDPARLSAIWSLNFLHLQVRSGWPTGFATHDAPYYFANGREVFEAGTGITYPNPYDPSDKHVVSISTGWFG